MRPTDVDQSKQLAIYLVSHPFSVELDVTSDKAANPQLVFFITSFLFLGTTPL